MSRNRKPLKRFAGVAGLAHHPAKAGCEREDMNDFFKRYLLPGFVFEAAVIGGGYATGRELVEFFLPAGAWGGLLGMAVSML